MDELKKPAGGRVIALAGNPNVGKSTVFNALTGMKQHTGNWPGKTVANAEGRYRYRGEMYTLVDVPGAYSLLASSAEEKIARDFICFGGADAVLIVADATCLERNLNLVLQILEITDRAVLCVNLMDEAEKKKIHINLPVLSEKLGIPVVGTSARSGEGLLELQDAVARVANGETKTSPVQVQYGEAAEQAVSLLAPVLSRALDDLVPARWAALKLLEGDESLYCSLCRCCGQDVLTETGVLTALRRARAVLAVSGYDGTTLTQENVTRTVHLCETLANETTQFADEQYIERDRRIDRVLTSKVTGIPILLGFLFFIFWLTIEGANAPSELLSKWLFSLQVPFEDFLTAVGVSPWLRDALADGVYRTVAWVVAVMLPPMAIFFPLFTLLEDAGFLPRIAFDLDGCFRRACCHGKQALTMCMGFGCNAAGVVGCRIIDSPRERLVAVVTNNFVPCNGRFPTLIALISMFFAVSVGDMKRTFVSTAVLTLAIVLSVVMTLLVSSFLSKTFLKGLPSSFILELPPYRRPQIGRVIVRSLVDRTLFVLSRAVLVAAPAGFIIWMLANTDISGGSLLSQCAAFLDPFARVLGMDGFILLAFILGFPANEIVVPILIMGYLSTGALTDYTSIESLRAIFVDHGWTLTTAVCTMLFSLMHWPCGTTFFTIRKETGKMKWALLSFAVPTVCGMLCCAAVAFVSRLCSTF